MLLRENKYTRINKKRKIKIIGNIEKLNNLCLGMKSGDLLKGLMNVSRGAKREGKA